MDHELAEGSRPLVAVPTMHHEQPAKMLELGDGEVGSEGSLFSFLKSNKIGHHQEHKRSRQTLFFGF